MSAQQRRPWADLPDLALLAILRFLHALPDLYAFAGACRSWRALLRSSSAADFPSLRPPLLLRPLLPPLPLPHPLQTPPVRPSGFRLQPLDRRNNGSTLYSSLLPREALPANSCLGCAFGFLILLRRASRRLLLVDALTAREIYLPELPPGRYPYYYAALTVPPSSPDCHALLFYSRHDVLSCRMGEAGSWVKHRLPSGASFITRVLVFKNRVYAVNDLAKIFVVDFVPQFSFKPMDVGRPSPMPPYDRLHFGPQLVECSGQMLLVIFAQVAHLAAMIHVYKLDFMKMEWVQMKSLCNFALFIDCAGRCTVSCPHPEGWGGQSNCIYLAGPGSDTWAEFPLDGAPINTHFLSPLAPENVSMPRWPSPVWIYPSLFF